MIINIFLYTLYTHIRLYIVYMYILCINKYMPNFTRLEVDMSFVKVQNKKRTVYFCRRGKQNGRIK